MIVNYVYFILHVMSTYGSIIINDLVIKLMSRILIYKNIGVIYVSF